jgi:hypothetical protein
MPSSKLRPSDVKLRRPAHWDGWIPTFTGSGFRPISPRVEDVRLEDIAQGLAYKFRYGGQSEPVTVAEHSILVSRIIEILWPSSQQMLSGLLHDACEAYTHDLQAPVRKHIRVVQPNGEMIGWGDMERNINQVIAKALGVGIDFYTAPEVQAADILAASFEKEQIPVLKRAGHWGLPNIPVELAGLEIEYLSPKMAKDAFVGRFHALSREVPEQPDQE